MFSIGEFARFTRVSVRALRSFAESGLLQPAQVDPDAGQPRYVVEQVSRLNRIVLLHDLGLSPHHIAELLTSDDAELEQVWQRREAEMVRTIHQLQTQLRAVRARRELVSAEPAGQPYQVTVRSVEPLLVAALSGEAEDIATLFYRLESYVRELQARAGRPPLTLLPEDDDGPITALVPINRMIPTADGIQVKLLDAVPRMACVVHRGGYPGLAGLLQDMLRWLAATGERPAGPIREVYLRIGDAGEFGLSSEFVTGERTDLAVEVQVPLRDSAA